MKKFTFEQLDEIARCGGENLNIRADTPEQAIEYAAHLVELGARWWNPVHEVETEYPDGRKRRWVQGCGVFVFDRDGGSVRLDVLVATHGEFIAKAA